MRHWSGAAFIWYNWLLSRWSLFISKYLLQHYNIIHRASIVAVMEPKVEGYKDHFAQHEKTITKDKNRVILVLICRYAWYTSLPLYLTLLSRILMRNFPSPALFSSIILVINLYELSFSKFKKWFLVSLMVQRRRGLEMFCPTIIADLFNQVPDENLSGLFFRVWDDQARFKAWCTER